MYIYRAVRTRGKSLQEDANQLESTATTPSYLLTNSHADCKHLTPGLAVPSKKRATADWAAPLRQSRTQHPWLNLRRHRGKGFWFLYSILTIEESDSKDSLLRKTVGPLKWSPPSF